MTGQRKNARRRLWPILALAIGLTGGAVLCEFTLRLYLTLIARDAVPSKPFPYPANPWAAIEYHQLVYWVDNPRISYQLRPFARGLFKGDRMALNSLGLRYREIGLNKNANTFRVVAIGDSTLFGWRVPEGQRYVDWLEEGLQDAFGAGRRVEVIPAAVPAWNALQEIEYFHQEALKLKPDAVLIQVDQNDNWPPFIRVQPHFFTAPKCYLLRLGSLWRGTLLAEELRDPRVVGPEGVADFVRWSVIREAFERLATTCRDWKIPLMATFAIRHDRDGSRVPPWSDTESYKQLESICAQLKIDLIDPTDPAYLKPWPDAPWPAEGCLFIPEDGHLNPLGHAVVAAAIFPEFLKRLTPRYISEDEAQKALGRFKERMAPRLIPPANRGLYPAEEWNGTKVQWAQERVRLPIEPGRRSMELNYQIPHPDISAQNPVTLEFLLDDRTVAHMGHTQGGNFAQEIPLTETSKHLEIRTSRSFRQNGLPRAFALISAKYK